MGLLGDMSVVSIQINVFICFGHILESAGCLESLGAIAGIAVAECLVYFGVSV